MKKILFFQWHSFMNDGIERALQKLNIEYDVFFYQFKDWEHDEAFSGKLRDKLTKNAYQCVFSVNFAPLISNLCEAFGLPYLSWVYDSPVHIRNLDTMKNSCNTIYFFDRGEALEYEKMGIPAKHLPLAADISFFQEKIQNRKKNQHYQISLLGNLYQTEYSHFMAPLDEYLKGYLEAILQSQMKLYGAYILPELITEELLEKMNALYKQASADSFSMGRRELEFLLAQEITGRERYLALALLSSHFPVDLFSSEKDDRLKNVTHHGYVSYITQMPSVFASSDINLNISLKCIRTGIPLRVIEACGCGGFVLSNYQTELGEYFKFGEECEIYENLEDLYLKTEFYLTHEELRREIAKRGQERVKRDFSFEDRMRTIFGKIE